MKLPILFVAAAVQVRVAVEADAGSQEQKQALRREELSVQAEQAATKLAGREQAEEAQADQVAQASQLLGREQAEETAEASSQLQGLPGIGAALPEKFRLDADMQAALAAIPDDLEREEKYTQRKAITDQAFLGVDRWGTGAKIESVAEDVARKLLRHAEDLVTQKMDSQSLKPYVRSGILSETDYNYLVNFAGSRNKRPGALTVAGTNFLVGLYKKVTGQSAHSETPLDDRTYEAMREALQDGGPMLAALDEALNAQFAKAKREAEARFRKNENDCRGCSACADGPRCLAYNRFGGCPNGSFDCNQ